MLMPTAPNPGPMAGFPPPIVGQRPAKDPERFTQTVVVFVALIAATGAVAGFLSAREAGQAGADTRAGLAAQSRASEQHITVGRILDADFDYISEAEILAFTATEYDSAGLTEDADRSRGLSRYLLTHTYGYYSEYYADAEIGVAVDDYLVVGFDAIWAAYGAFRDDLNAEVTNAQAVADQHLANASYAGRRSEGFLLTVAIVAVAAALGTVAVATKLPRVKVIVVVVVLALYSIGLLNLVVTFVA